MIPDVIVIGAGAAGCVLASRLSADPTCNVLLLEAGGSDWNPVFRVPIMAGVLLRQSFGNWLSHTEAEPQLDDRHISWPRGKVVGGSTSINGMIWHRGRPSDYERWAEQGLPNWGWESVKPHFEALERREFDAGAVRDAFGGMPVEEGKSDNPLHEAFLRAAEQAGHERIRDYNEPPFEGAGRYFFTIARGERWSAARAFLRPALRRKNLRLLTRAQACRLEVEEGRVTGVAVRLPGGDQTIRAGKVVLAAGTLATPQILMLSGIGPAPRLRELGIPVVVHQPGVGRNLQDHLSVRVQHACAQPVTLHSLTRMDRAVLAFLQAAVLRRGVGTAMPIGSGIHFRSDPSLPEPDIQAFFTPSHSQATVRLPFCARPAHSANQHAFSLSFYVMRPESRGVIDLRNSDPLSEPLIRAGYLSDPRDRSLIHRALIRVRDIMTQPALDPYRGEELTPGVAVRSSGDIDEWIAATAGSSYHPVGTCRMGHAGVEMAVVDERLDVFGVEGLKIADASVMPLLPSGNTMAPTMMIASRCAEWMR